MVANAPFIAPKAPFVIVTRKGGFPAATVVEAQRVVRPLVADEKTTITDAGGRKYTAREFLTAVQQAEEVRAATPAARPAMSTDLKDWASSTSDIDLDGEPPSGWPPPPTPSIGTPSVAAGRSSGRMLSPGARGRPISDRRPTHSRRPEETASSTRVLLVIGAVVLAAGIAAVVWVQSAPAAPAAPTASAAPAAPAAPVAPVATPTVPPSEVAPVAPAYPTLTPDGRVRPQDRPLPTYMR